MSANRVLLVEDEETIRDLLKEVLETVGPHTVLEAENGQEAMKVLESNQVDFMVSDLAMPIMGGLDLFEKLRSKGINIPTIVLTGIATKEMAIKALRLGVIDILEKPIRTKDFVRAVNDLKVYILSSQEAESSEDKTEDPAVTIDQELRKMCTAIETISMNKFVETNLNVIIHTTTKMIEVCENNSLHERLLPSLMQLSATTSRLRLHPAVLMANHAETLSEAYKHINEFISHQRKFKERSKNINEILKDIEDSILKKENSKKKPAA